MRGKKKKLLEAGVIFYIRWSRLLSMPLFGLQGAKLCFPLSLFGFPFPPLTCPSNLDTIHLKPQPTPSIVRI